MIGYELKNGGENTTQKSDCYKKSKGKKIREID